MNKNAGAVIGFIAGVPVSYYFQSESLRMKLSLPKYVQALPELLEKYPGDVLPPLVIACAVLAIGGFFAGKAMSKPDQAKSESGA